jgi:hypothetical protein
MNEMEILEFVKAQHILLLQKQVFKDFESISNHFPEDFLENCYSFDQIIFLVEENLASVLEKNETKTLQLFYTIDIPEKQFLRLISSENAIQKLSEAILFREAQKVYFRIKYS